VSRTRSDPKVSHCFAVVAMLCLSPTAAALLGVLLALASVYNAFACSSYHTTNEHHLEDPSTVGGAHGPRGLVEEDGTTAETHGSPGGYRRLQQAITVNVNFVNFKNSAGEGATAAIIRAQMDVLNAAYGPDFVFNYTVLDVTNDTYYGNIDSANSGNDPTEIQMKQQYKRGNMETMNVYAVSIFKPPLKLTQGWAFLPQVNAGFIDGIVLDWTSMPGVSAADLGMVRMVGVRS
jgi:hypothetical protein